MNAYWITSKEIRIVDTIVPYQDTYVPVYDTASYGAIVIAESRGKAKSAFVHYHQHHGMEWTDIESVRLIANHVQQEAVVIDDCPEIPHTDPLWRTVATRFWPDYWTNIHAWAAECDIDLPA